MDWWYLSVERRQHIFFYSPQAIEFIAQQQGYVLHVIEGFLLFLRLDCSSKLELFFLKGSLRGKLNRYLKYKIMRKPTPGVWKDYLLQKASADKKSKEQH
jgi:hypothetical protein